MHAWSDPIPQARVVRNAGQLVAPPRAPRAPRRPRPRHHRPIALRVREGLAIAVGLWPLTAVMLLVFGLVVMAAHMSAP